MIKIIAYRMMNGSDSKKSAKLLVESGLGDNEIDDVVINAGRLVRWKIMKKHNCTMRKFERCIFGTAVISAMSLYMLFAVRIPIVSGIVMAFEIIMNSMIIYIMIKG